MFKKLLFAIYLFVLAQTIHAQKLDSVTAKNSAVFTASLNKKELGTPKNGLSKDSLRRPSNDTLVSKSKDSLTLKSGDTSLFHAKNALLSPKMPPIVAPQMDSIWLKSGDTLVGFVQLDKDKNAFLFSKDSVENRPLNPEQVIKLIAFPKKSAEERLDVFSVFNEFYFLETHPDAVIRVFANRKFKAVVNDGPKYFIVENKYCLFKNDVPYFINSSRSDEILVFLMKDCKAVMDGFKSKKYTKNNFLEAVTQYNRCNKANAEIGK